MSTRMASGNAVLTVAVLLASLLGLSLGQTEVITCRRSEEVSRCVDAPTDAAAASPLCRYRVCAFSFVRAKKCDGNFEARATHFCAEQARTEAVWRCTADGEHRRLLLPLGCQGDQCTDEEKACECELQVVERTHLEMQNLILDECPVTV